MKPVWLKVQELAFREDESSFEELMELVLTAERKSIKLPVIRTATKDCEFDKGTWRVKEGDTIILDIVSITVRQICDDETDCSLPAPSK